MQGGKNEGGSGYRNCSPHPQAPQQAIRDEEAVKRLIDGGGGELGIGVRRDLAGGVARVFMHKRKGR